MIVVDHLDVFLDFVRKHEKKPTIEQFNQNYLRYVKDDLKDLLEDFSGYRGFGLGEHVQSMEWDGYRQKVLGMDSRFERERFHTNLKRFTEFAQKDLRGRASIIGAFALMDGYARFDQGSHHVFFGVDEEHGAHSYLDILCVHELGHVARESEAEVWSSHGLNPKMTHDELTSSMPLIEHVFAEGFSCVISELLNPGEHPSRYTYQSRESYDQVMRMAPQLDQQMRTKFLAGESYRHLYRMEEFPPYSHYVWAWAWVRSLVTSKKGEIDLAATREWIGKSSKPLRDSYLKFCLT